jgi:hypothetical protein
LKQGRTIACQIPITAHHQFHFSPNVIRFGQLEQEHIQCSNSVVSVRRWLVAASVVLSSPILVTLMKEALRSSETSVFTRATRRNIPEDAILHSHRCEKTSNLALYKWTGITAIWLEKEEETAVLWQSQGGTDRRRMWARLSVLICPEAALSDIGLTIVTANDVTIRGTARPK